MITAKKKMVVIGGAGFIGSHLTDALVKEGYDVHVVDNLVGGKKEHVNDQAVLYEVDIRDKEKLDEIFRGADSVFHFAALPRVVFSIDNPLETSEVNIMGTINVFTSAHQAGVRRVVYSASSSAYGDQKTLPLHEEMFPNPKSPYGMQKHVGELVGRVWNEVYGMETVSLRYFNVYGPRLDPEGAYALVIGKFLKTKKEGKPLTIYGDGEQTRDFTHVRDVVRANMLASESKKVGGGEVINIGAGRNVSINKLAELIGGDVEYREARLEPKHTQADNNRAKELLGWEPAISLEEGISELKELWQVD